MKLEETGRNGKKPKNGKKKHKQIASNLWHGAWCRKCTTWCQKFVTWCRKYAAWCQKCAAWCIWSTNTKQQVLDHTRSGMSGNSSSQHFPKILQSILSQLGSGTLFFIPVPNPKIWQYCFSFPFPIPKLGNTVSHSHSQILRRYIGNIIGN